MRKLFFLFAIVSVLSFPLPSQAQKVYRIGALLVEEQFAAAVDGFKKKMEEFGFVEGKNIQYRIYNAELDREKLRQYAGKLVRERPDLIVTSSTTATIPVAALTKGTDLPVVFLSSGNPLELVKSYAASGNNLTGVSAATLDLTGKRLELLKELLPRAKRLVSLNNPKGVNYRDTLTVVRQAAKRSGLAVREVDATNREELIRVMPSITARTADAILLQPDVGFVKNIDVIVEQSLREKVPVFPTLIPNVRKGGLATYAPDYFALGQQGAVLANKILKGSKPGDLPIEQPNHLVLAINLRTAKTLGIRVSKELLLRADEVFE